MSLQGYPFAAGHLEAGESRRALPRILTEVAARLESLAEPEGICISGTVCDQIKSKLAQLQILGERVVK